VKTSRRGRNICRAEGVPEAVMRDGLCEASVCIGLIDLDGCSYVLLG
jgi:hypothetical protein